MALGAVVYRIGVGRDRRHGRHRAPMPLTMAAFVVAGLGIIGVPGTAGFISKWYLALGALEKGYWPLVFLIVASSLIAVVYIGRVVEAAYFREPSARPSRRRTSRRCRCWCRCIVLAAATSLARHRYALQRRHCGAGGEAACSGV